MPARRRLQFGSAVRSLLSVEVLETRALMAGNVTASVSKGTLTIRGDGAANEIIISQLTTNGGYKITPVDGSGTTVNSSATAIDMLNVVRFDIKLLGGDDKLGIGNDVEFVGELFAAFDDFGEEEEEPSEPAGLQAQMEEESEEETENELIITLFGDDDDEGFDIDDPEFTPQQLAQLPTRVTGLTSIDLGDGNDTLVSMIRTVSNVNVLGGKGDDAILSILTTSLNMTIHADPAKGEGMGNDLVAVVMSNVRQDLAITTESLDDAVVVLGTKVSNLGVNAGGPVTGQMTDDDFVVAMNVSAADNIGLHAEVGDDNFFIDSIIADILQVTTGAGDDEVDLVGLALTSLLVDTAAGDDAVHISAGEDGFAPLVVRRNFTINTGADDDSVNIDGGLLGLFVGGQFDVKTGTGDDLLLLERVTVGKGATIDMDIGNDMAFLDGLDVRLDLNVNLGAGNDVLTVHDLSANRSSLRGGTGNDVLHDLGDHSVSLTKSQWEAEDDGSV